MGYKNLTEEEQNKFNEQLFKAIKRNTLSAVKSAVKAGANVNAKDSDGDSILQIVIDKDIEIVKCLLEAGANPDIQNSIGWTALHHVTWYGVNKVKLLLNYKANIYTKDNKGRTPFDLSLLYNKYNIAELFISNGYIPSEEDMQKIKNNRLFEAVKENNLPAVKAAIADGANVNAKKNNGNPLLLYAEFPDAKIMRYLLENGMNPNMKDDNEWSLLHIWASYQEEFIDSIKLLLKHGADMTVKNKWGDTSFRVALSRENYNIAELFILNGYVPSEYEFNFIKDETIRESFMTLAAQMQEHNTKLIEEAQATSQEFSYADEVMEM